jgi:acyl-CoA synthetase (AMP-forming)/AMP-acid ligase II
VTPADLLQRELRRDGTRPLLTWYDDRTGERVELSVATTANWAAKTANLLLDEYDVSPGDTVTVHPAWHWLSFVALIGVWTAGAAADLAGSLPPVLPGDVASFMSTVLAQPDDLLGSPVQPDEDALAMGEHVWSHRELVEATGTPPERCRVLTTLPLASFDGVRACVLAPLAAGGSAVLVVNADVTKLADRARTERVTHTAGIDLPGYPPLP